MKNVCVFFDLDKTILSTSSSMALRKPFVKAGITTRGKNFIGILSQLEYLLFGANDEKTEKMKERIANLSIGINIKQLEEITDKSFDKYIYPKCYSHMLDLIEIHKASHYETVLASASTEQIVKPIAKHLNMDHYLGTTLEVEEDEFTGNVKRFMYSKEKAFAAKKLAEQNNWDLENSYAYSDSITDLPLLELVGNPVVVNPDKELERIAINRNWRIIKTNEKQNLSSQINKIVYSITLATILLTGISLLKKKK
ncbi:HAD-IB family hydrolase [Actinomyces sp. zg-332]|uniref:HAD family hydrolase n=1 Tax=Actinomyces sp. zg-332 TaxID=2708340 RepID=UPI00141E117E|nr:HAD-IB family hydrolase [Actinomyces sp. zg-332]QPK94111.1 HAD-IB family hydrolase [Actinomyces sp. zg-332]